MKQYTTNAIYEYIKHHPHLLNDYLYIQEHNWILVYGTAAIEPKLVLIASQVEKLALSVISSFEEVALKVMQHLHLPVRVLRFSPGQFSASVVISDTSNTRFEEIETKELYTRLFEPYGLPADPAIAAKPVNDATSSTFHDWQRNFLSGKIKVSDVDLVRYNKDFKPVIVFELKRSKIPLAKWEPYAVDYPNFRLLRKAFPTEIPIYITYNLLSSSSPREEDISVIRLFRIEDASPKIVKVYKNNNPDHSDFLLNEIIK